jgi:hypothetical protein
MLNEWQKNDGSFRRDRRDFLRLGSVAIVGIATTAAVAENATQGIAEAFISQPLPLLGVGYCNPGSAQPSRLIAAANLPSGDALLRSAPVRVSVKAFHRASQHGALPMSVGLNVHYPGDARFMAWHSSVRGSRSTNSSPVSFLASAEDSGALTMSLESRTPRTALARRLMSQSEPRVEESVFSLGFASGAKLRRGIYVVAFRESSGEKTPDWSSLRFDAADSRIHGSAIIGSRPAPFSYVVLSTGYGDKA